MSDEQQDDGQGADAQTNEPGRTDWFLASLVQFANNGMELPLTLTVGGTQVSGILIGGRAYYDEFEEIFTKGWKAEVAQAARGMFDQHRSIYDQPEDDPDYSPPPPTFIHLRNARFFGTGQPIPANGALWRGRLERVDGFSLGVLNLDEPEDA